jgi:dihydropteroate synthase
MKIAWKNFCLDFTKKTCVMGILNVTPDSFSDGGVYFEKSAAIDSAFQMIEDGADIIDVGGESTRPSADPVPLDEELRRVLPVIEALSSKVNIPLSIDTYKAEVARNALAAGASIVNDISGLRFDPGMPEVVAEHGVPVVVMHIKGTPRDMQVDPVYGELIPEILAYLRESIEFAKKAGVNREMIIIDPGIGFGKTFSHNLEIINNLYKLKTLGTPLLVGPSRKAFIGRILGDAPAGERVEGTAAAVAVSIMKGADIVRVHDVKEMAKAAKVADAIKRHRV